MHISKQLFPATIDRFIDPTYTEILMLCSTRTTRPLFHDYVMLMSKNIYVINDPKKQRFYNNKCNEYATKTVSEINITTYWLIKNLKVSSVKMTFRTRTMHSILQTPFQESKKPELKQPALSQWELPISQSQCLFNTARQ